MDLEEPITTQEQLDAIIGDRLKRDRKSQREKLAAEYADYDELKAKAEQLDAVQAELDELRRADEDRKAADELAKVRAEVSEETGVPAELLRGSTRDELAEHAKAIAAAYKPAPAPKVGGSGSFSNESKSDSDMRDL